MLKSSMLKASHLAESRSLMRKTTKLLRRSNSSKLKQSANLRPRIPKQRLKSRLRMSSLIQIARLAKTSRTRSREGASRPILTSSFSTLTRRLRSSKKS